MHELDQELHRRRVGRRRPGNDQDHQEHQSGDGRVARRSGRLGARRGRARHRRGQARAAGVAAHAGAASRRGARARGGGDDQAQGRAGARADARRGQDARRVARRGAEGDQQPRVPVGRRAAAQRRADPVGAAVDDVLDAARAARRGVADYAVELPGGDPDLEAGAGAGVRQHGGAQAGVDHAVDGEDHRRDLRGGGAAQGRAQRRLRPRLVGGADAGRASRRQGDLVHRLQRGRRQALRRRRGAPEEGAVRDGRQESGDRARGRGSRAGGDGDGAGRVRLDGPALHGDLARHRRLVGGGGVHAARRGEGARAQGRRRRAGRRPRRAVRRRRAVPHAS